jgi:UDP-N-acetylmuramate--alanine ligase
MYPDLPITTIFQPHLFSRTNDFMIDFARELAICDQLLLLPIYPARELPLPNVTSEKLASLVVNSSVHVIEKDNLLAFISGIVKGVILTVGAGDIDRFVEPIKEILSSRSTKL